VQQLNIVLWGLGAMGSGIFKLLSERRGVRITGAIGRNPAKIGKDLGEVVGLGQTGIIITDNAHSALAGGDAKLVMHSTGSFFKDIYHELLQAVRAGYNVITIAEEMAEPWSADKKMADDLDREAKKRGVSVIGTGINPGFVLDALIIALSGVCFKINKIEAKRVNDLSPFGHTVMSTQGVGTTPEEFKLGINEGTIVGHIGFTQSIKLISKALGWELDEIIEEKEPIITSTVRETAYIRVEPGMVAGCNHSVYGFIENEAVIILKHPQQICPDNEGISTGDYIYIDGTPPLNLSIEPEIPGGIGTIAMAVNIIPILMASSPGLKTMLDLSYPSSWNKLE